MPPPGRPGARSHSWARGNPTAPAGEIFACLDSPGILAFAVPTACWRDRAKAPSMLHCDRWRSPRCPWSIRHGPWPSPTPRRSGNRWARCCAPPERHDRIDEARGQLRSPNVAASRTVPRPTTWRSSPLALRLAVSTATWSAGASRPCSGAGYFCWPETAGDEEPDRRRSSAARFVAHRVKPTSCEDLTRLLVGSEGTLRDELGVGRRRRRSWR